MLLPLTWSVMSDSEAGRGVSRSLAVGSPDIWRRARPAPARPAAETPAPVRNNRREGDAGLAGVVASSLSMIDLPRVRHCVRGLRDNVGLPAIPIVIRAERVGGNRAGDHRLHLGSGFQKLPEHMPGDEGQESIGSQVVQQPLVALPALVNLRPPECVQAQADS